MPRMAPSTSAERGADTEGESQSSYGAEESKISEFCAEHAEDEIVNIPNKRCGHRGCTQRPFIAVDESNKTSLCTEHP